MVKLCHGKVARTGRGAFLAVLFFGAVNALPVSAMADDVFHDSKNFLSGVYGIKGFRAAGIYSSVEESEARKYIGRRLTVHGAHVALPTGDVCHVVATNTETLKNDRESFGSSGGSWSELGLEKISGNGYKVADIAFDCGNGFSGMIVQPESGVYLLKS